MTFTQGLFATSAAMLLAVAAPVVHAQGGFEKRPVAASGLTTLYSLDPVT